MRGFDLRQVLSGLTAVAVASAILPSVPAMAADGHDALLSRIRLPPGFEISIFAELPKPRSIALGKPFGTIFVGSRRGTVHSLRDIDRDGKADEVVERADGLEMPNGVAIQDDRLYVALTGRIVRWDRSVETDTAPRLTPLTEIMAGLPSEYHHGWRYAGFGPDRKLYVSIGAPCNICRTQGLEGTIIRLDPDGGNMEVVAKGVRNSVGFDWHPETGVLYFTDNGADGMGDEIPPDELNKVSEIGQDFGFPHMGGKAVRLSGFENAAPPPGVVPPVIEFAAHSANLGIRFYDGDMFPAEYRHDAFVAQHGSWNRTEPIGYRIVRVKFDDRGEAVSTEVFADGWLENGDAIGRPVDIAQLPDGSLLVSDDFANVIYRITYAK